MKRAMSSPSFAVALCAAFACSALAFAPGGVRAAAGGPTIFGFDGVPLGAFIDGAWREYPDGDDDKLLRGGKVCRVYGFSGLETDSAVIVPDDEAVKPREEWEQPPRYTLSARTGSGAVVGEGSARLVVVGDHDAMPRTAQVLPPDNARYQKIVSEYLAGRGLAVAGPNIAQLLRVDLDGDGTDEVLITAQNVVPAGDGAYSFAPGRRLLDTLRFGKDVPRARAGQYAVVLLRRVVGGEARTIPLLDDFIAKETPPRAPDNPYADEFQGKIHVHRIDAIADLNGDGVMEIIASTASAYALTYAVLEIKGDRVGVVKAGVGYSYED